MKFCEICVLSAIFMIISINGFASEFNFSTSNLSKRSASDFLYSNIQLSNSTNRYSITNCYPFSKPNIPRFKYSDCSDSHLPTSNWPNSFSNNSSTKISPSIFDKDSEKIQGNNKQACDSNFKNVAMATGIASVGVGIGGALYSLCQNLTQTLRTTRESESQEDAIRQEGDIVHKFSVKLRREVANLKDSSEYREASPNEQAAQMQRLFSIIEQEKVEKLNGFRSKINDNSWSSYLTFWGSNKKVTDESEEVESESFSNAIAAINENDLDAFKIAISNMGDWEKQEQEKLIMRANNCAHLSFIKQIGYQSQFSTSIKNVTGKLLLNYASSNHLRQLQELVLYGKAYINSIDNYGYSALDFAVKGDNLEMVKFLVQNGALVRKGSYSQQYIMEIRNLLPNLVTVTPLGQMISWLERAIEK